MRCAFLVLIPSISIVGDASLGNLISRRPNLLQAAYDSRMGDLMVFSKR